jgi:hypothetical protein
MNVDKDQFDALFGRLMTTPRIPQVSILKPEIQ